MAQNALPSPKVLQRAVSGPARQASIKTRPETKAGIDATKELAARVSKGPHTLVKIAKRKARPLAAAAASCA